MKILTSILLSIFLVIGMYMTGYSMLYLRKVNEAQQETSVETPKKIVLFLRIGIFCSLLIVLISLMLLLYETMLS